MKKSFQKNSLHPLPHDQRDFRLGAISFQTNIENIPDSDWEVSGPLLIKDQGESDLCSAYAVTSVSEDQEGEELLPEYQFFKTKQISGNPDQWGANLRDACKSAVKYGSLPIKNGLGKFKGISRKELLNDETWPHYSDEVASCHRKKTYFSVDGRYDVFDNIRTALWKYRYKRSSIVTGVLWRYKWLEAKGGIISSQYGDGGFGHAFKIFGQKTIKGKMYLVAQLSQGKTVGDDGLFYFSREIVNREIGKYGIFMFNDIPVNQARKTMGRNQSFINRLWSFLKKLFQ